MPLPGGVGGGPGACSFSRLLTLGGVVLVLLASALFVSFATTGTLFFGTPAPVTGEAGSTGATTGTGGSLAQPQRPWTSSTGSTGSGGAVEVPVTGTRPVAPPATAPTTDEQPAPGASHPVPGAIPLPFEPIPANEVAARAAALPAPHGGVLRDLRVSPARRQELESDIAEGRVAHSWTLTMRQACDIELLLNGGFSPLDGFMTESTYASVVARQRLDAAYGNVVWPMPITLDVPAERANALAAELAGGGAPPRVALRDDYHNLIAVLTVGDVYRPDKVAEATAVFRTTDTSHPGVGYLMATAGEYYVGGKLEGVALPKHYDFNAIRLTPEEVRAEIVARGWPRTVAFQTRNPMHRAHIELTKLAAVDARAGVLLHPSVGMTKPGDVEANVRVRCYQAMVESRRYYADGGVLVSLLPLAMRMAGPVEALWHAIIRKNHGASHFIVGRDHAGCKSAGGDDFYGAYDAQALVSSYAAELGITILKYNEVEYVPRLDRYLPSEKIDASETKLSISGTKFRGMMNRGDPIPEWFSDPDVIAILRELMPPLHKRGFALFFTGLSGGGKTTIAHGLIQRLAGLMPTRRITFLDGDVVRTHLSKGLGFSIADRNANVARIGWVAAEAVRHGGIVLASAIAPFAESRRAFRSLTGASGGGFFQIYVASSLGVCAARDVKGLYELAANGKTDLTGVSHPYELPDDGTDLVIDTERVPVDDAVAMIVSLLGRAGYVNADAAVPGNVVRELSEVETALLGALRATDAKSAPPAGTPAAVLALARSFTAGAVDVAASATGGLGVGAGMCTPGWDRLTITKAASDVTLYGGLPMKASAAYLALRDDIPRDDATGSVLVPPDNLILGLAPGPLAGVAAHALWASRFKASASLEAAPVYILMPSRFATAEAVGAVAAGDETAASALLAALIANATATTGSQDAVLALTTRDVLPRNLPPHAAAATDAASATGTPVGSRLPESARLAAAFDLWTHMRWHRVVESGEADADAVGGRSTSAFLHPRLSVVAPHIMRLDPCAHIVAALPTPDAEAAVAEAMSAALPAASRGPAAVEAFKAYLTQYSAAVAALAKSFPTRVTVLHADAPAVAFGAAVTAGKTPAAVPPSVAALAAELAAV